MLDVGVIGVGPRWDTRYRPALEAIRNRMRVRAVAAPVTAIAEAAAADLRSEVAPGLLALVERKDIRAVLVLEPSWQGEVPALLALQSGKPVFLSEAAEAELAAVTSPADDASVVMPELPLRYTPATQRLRELLATRLGRVRQVELHVPGEDADEVCRPTLIDALDWCRSLVGDCIARVIAREDQHLVRLELSRPSGESITIDVRRRTSPGIASRLACEKGTISIEGSRQLSWRMDDAEQSETLESDRGALEVMLDHFSRRVVGGLVPVPTLDDVSSARRLVELIQCD